MKKYTAEVIGTFILVFFGCGTAVFLSAEAGEAARHVGISLAFGFALIAAAYGIGPISGAHLNPAVSLGMHLSGRMSMSDIVRILRQFARKSKAAASWRQMTGRRA